MIAAIVWFRDDLRLDDNPALREALESGRRVLPVYIHDPEAEGRWAPGAASNAWRARSLRALAADLLARGAQLRFFHGDSGEVLRRLVDACNVDAVYWNQRYEPGVSKRDAELMRDLRESGLEVEAFNASALFQPPEPLTGKGTGYRVFGAFWRAAQIRWQIEEPWSAPPVIQGVDGGDPGLPLESLGLSPRTRWDESFWNEWVPGEAGARGALEAFVDGAARGYAVDRDRPDRVGTSMLSPHLHFGEIAPWRVVEEVRGQGGRVPMGDIDAFVRQLAWREFALHLMHHAPQSVDCNLDSRFDAFDWASADSAAVDAWKSGRTGVPIVDAGMRQLQATGWMHNRVRMIVASYLCKHLRVHWRTGAEWFWDTLVDADLAANSMGWQWVAGTGADAAPYFRIFNPVTQAQRFDPKGEYVGTWVPEVASLPMPLRHAPWINPTVAEQLAPAYPRAPVVDLAEGRTRALDAYRRLANSR